MTPFAIEQILEHAAKLDPITANYQLLRALLEHASDVEAERLTMQAGMMRAQAAADNTFETLKTDNSEYVARLARLESDVERLEAENKNLWADKVRLDRERKALTERLEAQNLSRLDGRKEIRARMIEADYANEKAANQSLTSTIARLEVENKALTERLNDDTDQRSQLAGLNRSLGEQLNVIRRDRDRCAQDNARLRAENDRLTDIETAMKNALATFDNISRASFKAD